MREGGRERSCRKNSFKPLAAKLISLLKFLAVHKQNLIVMLLMEHTSKRTHTDSSKHPHRRIQRHKLKPYTACTHLQLLPHVPQFHSLFALHFCHIAALAPFFTLLLHWNSLWGIIFASVGDKCMCRGSTKSAHKARLSVCLSVWSPAADTL